MKKESLKTMRDHLDNLSREWESISKIFKSDDNVLYDFGKIAVCVEQAICSFVFPDTFEDGADANLHNLSVRKICMQLSEDGEIYAKRLIFPMNGYQNQESGMCMITMSPVTSEQSKYSS